ncbi:Histidine-trna ligase [Globisporangium polare]
MATAATRVTIGSGKLAVADVSAVAVLRAKVQADLPAAGPAFVHQLSAASEAKEQAASDAIRAQVEQAVSDLTAASVLSTHSSAVSRAVLVVLLHKLLRLPRATPAVIESAQFVADLLNANVTPVFVAGPADTATATLLAALEGSGLARQGESKVALEAALKAEGITLPAPLSTAEKELLIQGPVVLLAVNALTVAGARGLLPLSDAVAALTCETLRANSAPFEAEYVDASRPHRGIVTAATNLRLMLENSKFVNSRKDFAIDVECIRYIPQYHGPVRDAVLAAYKTVELELNSAITDGMTAKSVGALHPQVLQTSLASTLDSLSVLLNGSNERRQAVDASLVPLATASTCAIELVETVTKSLAHELELSLKVFDSEDEQIRSRLAEKNAKAQEAAAKAAAAAAKEDEKLAAMTEAQRNKILEKRKKKMEKTKEKDGAKKGAKEDVKIGAGSAAFRQFLQAAAPGTSLEATLNPFDLRPTGAATFIEELLVRIGSGGSRRKPKIGKGAQDFLPHQMQLREKIFNKIRMVFKRHAGVEIETPVFELKETLTGKYGEDSKLIYDLADQGGELLALRYDLTVPFARFMALHNPGNIKRYHIARVYRRDNPQMARGRFREFYQCDFDIAGSYAPMLPDAEVLSIGIEVLQQFPELGPVKVKLSHRLLLDAILAICGVPADKFRTTCSAIDKLDKEPWENVRREMVDDKGIPEPVADAIQKFVCKVGAPRALHEELTKENLFGDNAEAAKAMSDLKLLFDYLDAMGVLDYISFDLSLARGLDYYTGLIYEFVLTSPEHNVGSIAAGGRYDNLVGMFSATGQQIPCVGVSMGIERIFGILQAHAEKQSGAAGPTPPSQVLVASTGGALLLPKLAICKELWRANISAEVMQVENPKFTKQLHYALESGIPYMVVVGEDELASGQVKIKEMLSKDEVAVPREDMVAELLRRNCPTTNTLSI